MKGSKQMKFFVSQSGNPAIRSCLATFPCRWWLYLRLRLTLLGWQWWNTSLHVMVMLSALGWRFRHGRQNWVDFVSVSQHWIRSSDTDTSGVCFSHRCVFSWSTCAVSEESSCNSMIWLEHKFNYKLIDHVYDSFTSSKRYIIETGSRGTGFKLYYVFISVGFYTDISKLLSPAWSAARSLDGDSRAARAYQLALKFSYSSSFKVQWLQLLILHRTWVHQALS